MRCSEIIHSLVLRLIRSLTSFVADGKFVGEDWRRCAVEDWLRVMVESIISVRTK